MDYNELESLFIANPSSAIYECKNIICSISEYDSYKDFLSYHKKNAHFSLCPKRYTKNEEISILCVDCSLREDNPAVMCISCFLDGNHEGHNYFIFPKSVGICNCGDKNYMKNTGFCAKHQGIDDENNYHPENYLDEKLRNAFTDVIFKAAFSSLNNFNKTSDRKALTIIDFILSFTELGDGFRRLITITLIEKIDFDNFITNIPSNNSQFNNALQPLFFSLLTDQLFRMSFSKSFYHVITERIIKDSPTYMPHYEYETPHVMLSNFINFCFSEPLCRYNIEENQWDWVSMNIDLLEKYKQLFQFNLNHSFKFCPYVFDIIKSFPNMTSIQPTKETQEFFDKMFTEIFNKGTTVGIEKGNNDTIITTSFRDFIRSKYYSAYTSFIERFSYLFDCFKFKPNLKMDKLIEELNNIDITPIFLIKKNHFADENDVLISKYLISKNNSQISLFDKFKSAFKKIFNFYPSKYYKSFYNGASIFLSHPLFDSFVYLFKLDNFCQIKLAKFLVLENYQPLRVKLGIVALKRLLSVYCYEMNLTDNKNFALDNFYDNMIDLNKEIRYNLIPVSIIQLSIGLQCINKIEKDEFIIKEFFAYEIAREIGLFDKNYLTEIEDKMFIFLYVSLLIIIDRTVFNFDIQKVIEERLIFGLKVGCNSIEDLNTVVDVIPNKPHLFFKYINEAIMKIATVNNSNDDSNKEENLKLSNNDNSFIAKSNKSIKVHEHENDDNSDEDDDDEIDQPVDNNNDNNNNSNAHNSDDNNNNNRNDGSNHASKNIMKSDIKLYLKEGIECKLISTVNSINAQRNTMNIEISKNSQKLLRMQKFESEEEYFFKSNENNQELINSEGLNIRLKEILLTPTVFAVIYTVLIENNYNKTQNLVNEHLAMNILILISEIIKESASSTSSTSTETKSFDETIKINCVSIIDLVSKLKRTVYKFRIEGKDDNKQGFIENTMNSTNFVSLMKMKITFNKLPEKSFIDLLNEKGQIGQETLQRISVNIPLQEVKNKEEESEEQKLKKIKKEKANKLKSEIMNQFQNKMNQYNFSDSISESLSLSNSSVFQLNKEVCCLCSESSSKEILSYPLFLYRTKLPFIIDKPHLFDESTDGIAVDDPEHDFMHKISLSDIIHNFDSLSQREIDSNTILFSMVFDNLKANKKINNKNKSKKRLTVGANFVLQFGICPHPVHLSCIKNENKDFYRCSIDRSVRNCFLPFLDEIPINKIFSNTETFELNEDNSKIINSISSFIQKYTSYFDYSEEDSTIIFIELIKSISSLIETYEIRVRNRPDALDPPKYKILARNLFLLVWYYYRIQKKPKLQIFNKKNDSEIDLNSRLTDFQIFIKQLIENDNIIDDIDQIRKIASSIITSISSSSSSSSNSNELYKEKKICLFLRRLCLAEYFLLNESVSENEKDLIEWDDVLNTAALSKRYKMKFTSIDTESGEDFEFKPFLFMKLPKDYLKLSQSPYNYPIQFRKNYSFINFLDYNHAINQYNDFDETDCGTNDDDENDKNESNIDENSNQNDNNDNNKSDHENGGNDNSNNKNKNGKSDHENDENDNDNNNDNNKSVHENDNNNSKNEENNSSFENNKSYENDNNNNNSNESNVDSANDDKNEVDENNTNKDSDEDKNTNENENKNDDESNYYHSLLVDVGDILFGMHMLIYGKRVYPSTLMMINNQSPLILISDQSLLGFITPFYVDKFGCAQMNFSRHLPLSLNENYYEIFIDKILSGDFSYDLMTIEEISQMIS